MNRYMKYQTFRGVRFVLLLLLTLGTFQSPTAFAAKAIDFQFMDVTGKHLRLSDFKGKWVLVNFWTPGCPMCRSEAPSLNSLNQSGDVVVIRVGLDYGPDESVVKDVATSNDFRVTAIIAGGARRDKNSACRQVGPVDFYPTSYLYDPTGEIVMFIPGQVKQDKLLSFMGNWARNRNRTETKGD